MAKKKFNYAKVFPRNIKNERIRELLTKAGRKALRDKPGPIRRYNPAKATFIFLNEFQSRRVPPDLNREDDYNNTGRASAAQCGLIAFAEVTGLGLSNPEDGADVVADFVCDLAHYCDRKGLQLSEIIKRSVNHYHEETKGEGLQFVPTNLQPEVIAARKTLNDDSNDAEHDALFDLLEKLNGFLPSLIPAPHLKKMREALQQLVGAANNVIENWESSDLAGAVNELDAVAEEAAKLL